MLSIYIGYDSREREAFDVAAHSFRRRSSVPLQIQALDMHDLYMRRLLWRPVQHNAGKMHDHLSDSPQSTEFATSRFLTPLLHRTGMALFVDCDVVCLADPAELLALADPAFAVMCVKHDYQPRTDVKMDGQVQTFYPRKNWSSVVLFNCDHPAHYRLTLGMVNQWPGELLHRFAWLRDREIGALPPAWNTLVGEQPHAGAKLLHYTLGGPWLPGWKPAPADEIWHAEAADLRRATGT